MASPTQQHRHQLLLPSSKLLITPLPFARPFPLRLRPLRRPKPISAAIIPSSSSPAPKQQLYQPFRPPPSSLPEKFRNLDTASRLDILSNRLGLWYEYAPLIPSLVQEGFSPPSIEEATGISGVEQNRLVVAAKVRDTLVGSGTDSDVVNAFDTGGSELLYEIRLLSTSQRAAAAKFIIERELDAKGAQELARAMKDFPRRRGDHSWECFEYSYPGDCLAFMYFRQSREYQGESPSDRSNALERALEVAVSEKAKAAILKELEGKGDGEGGVDGAVAASVRVPVVRLRVGEVAEATSVVVLPVCRAEERAREVVGAPMECRTEGEFGVVVAEKGWERWVALPRWEALFELGHGGVVVAFGDGKALPWKVRKWNHEAILVVADRTRKGVTEDDGFYLVDHDGSGDGRGGGLKVERGTTLKEKGVAEALATVVLVVRPPKEDTENQSPDDWD